MSVMENHFQIRTYKEVNLLADPIHGYIHFTCPGSNPDKAERTERDLLDTPWMQRLRRIHQLQAVWWVFPSGEHSRFQHSLGVMHLGGLFAAHLYDSLKETTGVDKSRAYVEETLRLAGLLHDIGHGPFCHFFDEEYLDKNNYRDEHGKLINHEILGQKIIREKLKDIITKIKRSPSGRFTEADEEINVDYLCYLIKKGAEPSDRMPAWLTVLKGLMTGIYTIDNLDYVWRDAYMCGVLPKPIDIERLKHYTFTTKKGLALYLPALSALEEFLKFRFHMYTSIYYHRTVRAIELHMKEIFGKTIELLYGKINPYEDLDTFFKMDDWSILSDVQKWQEENNDEEKKALAGEWKQIIERKPKWKCLDQCVQDYSQLKVTQKISAPEELEREIRKQLQTKDIEFKIDLSQEDPRRLDPLYDIEDPSKVKIYDPAKETLLRPSEVKDFFEWRLPEKSVIFRLYVPREQSREHDCRLINAFVAATSGKGQTYETST